MLLVDNQKKKALSYVEINGQRFFKISHVDKLRPFLMSIVSDADHWMFIASNGGISAGRKNSDHSIFPYYTDDKLVKLSEYQGSKTIIKIKSKDGSFIWEPFSVRTIGSYNIEQNIYKNVLSNKVILEELNHTIGICFHYEWSLCKKFGLVRSSNVRNLSSNPIHLHIIDGCQNILPAGVTARLQNDVSNLVNAYKRSERVEKSTLATFSLTSRIVDKAIPSEALNANVAWSFGLENPEIILDSEMLESFRSGERLKVSNDLKATAGAYFVMDEFALAAQSERTWHICLDTDKNRSEVLELIELINENSATLSNLVHSSIDEGTRRLKALLGSADAFQKSNRNLYDHRHTSNVLFNILRGGIFDENYLISRRDLIEAVKTTNRNVYKSHEEFLLSLAPQIKYKKLISHALEQNDPDFTRIVSEYLPLKFSRRHGDPSRPWNKFNISLIDESTGEKVLDYEGNWRDIFQNWEALAFSYPEYLKAMIFRFLNASTFDGYNPYRITKDGFDWEIIEADDPWSYIGYWGDHQIIYLLKFLELQFDIEGDQMNEWFDSDLFVYANVPYRIKAYSDILQNPKDTIEFDGEQDRRIRDHRDAVGADGALLSSAKDGIYHVNFIEKILATLLSKISNFIPDGGIWMNTQRPEWNDANNALVGNGISMVTLCYMRRFLVFFDSLIKKSKKTEFNISKEFAEFFDSVTSILSDSPPHVGQLDDSHRRQLMNLLGQAGSDYRVSIYNNGYSGIKSPIKVADIRQLIERFLKWADHTISNNKKKNGLFHSYNLITLEEGTAGISYLDDMLEGQVSILSCDYLNLNQAVSLLDSLRTSELYRNDQSSYLLYPYRDLPGFLDKNRISESRIQNSNALLSVLAKTGQKVLRQSKSAGFLFVSEITNSFDLKDKVELLRKTEDIVLDQQEETELLDLYEETFNHKAFTGRSGTFYGYEGLGSIYWHMVSKLRLAIAENCRKFSIEHQGSDDFDRLVHHYYEITDGLGVHKSPELYGAFPTDPYSHTPLFKGAQQPGMTGQVKEDILSRWIELGLSLEKSRIRFQPRILRIDEFVDEPTDFHFIDFSGKEKSIPLISNQLAFTYCQTPIIYELGNKNKVSCYFLDGNTSEIMPNEFLTNKISSAIISKDGSVGHIHVMLDSSNLVS